MMEGTEGMMGIGGRDSSSFCFFSASFARTARCDSDKFLNFIRENLLFGLSPTFSPLRASGKSSSRTSCESRDLGKPYSLTGLVGDGDLFSVASLPVFGRLSSLSTFCWLLKMSMKLRRFVSSGMAGTRTHYGDHWIAKRETKRETGSYFSRI